MDSLVRMRYLFDTLQPKEQQEAIKRLTASRMQWIMTLIFNHFAERLHNHPEDQSAISSIIKAISSVIIDRQSEARSDKIESQIGNESEVEDQSLSMDEMPSVMISKVASYLNQNDYIHFSHSSRRILIGCHSPFSLYHLNVCDENYREHGVRSAASAHSLTLSFRSTEMLDSAESFPYKSNVERLVFQRAMSSDAKEDFFIFISMFPNIKCIDISERSFRYTLDGMRNDIPTLPALKGTVYYFAGDVSSETQRSLVMKHATQIEALKIVLLYQGRVRSPDPALCNLKELKWMNRTLTGTFTRHVLFEWIENSKKLEIFSIDCSRLPFVAELITFLIEKQPDLQFMEFKYDDKNEVRFMQQIENGLFMSKLREKGKEDGKKELKVRIRFEKEWMRPQPIEAEKAEEILDGFGHLAQILGGCDIQHFMVQMVTRVGDWVDVIWNDENREAAKSKLNGLLQKWNGEYRVDSFFKQSDNGLNDVWYITFCNKDNPMKDGFRAHGLFVE